MPVLLLGVESVRSAVAQAAVTAENAWLEPRFLLEIVLTILGFVVFLLRLETGVGSLKKEIEADRISRRHENEEVLRQLGRAFKRIEAHEASIVLLDKEATGDRERVAQQLVSIGKDVQRIDERGGRP